MLTDREITPSEHEIAASLIVKNNVEYVRREYFKDGQRIFFSPLDFALNGPLVTTGAKTTLSAECENGHLCKVAVIEKHHENNDPTPCYITVRVTWETKCDLGVFENEFADIITKDCELVRSRFGFSDYSRQGTTYFAIHPHFWRKQDLYKNRNLPYNRISRGIQLTTGLNPHSLVRDDRYD